MIRLASALFLILCAGTALFAAGPADTLMIKSDGRDIPIPFQKKTDKTSPQSGKMANWDTTICTPLPAWNVLTRLSSDLEGCKQDWNRLLELGQSKDSVCKASIAESARQQQLVEDRNTNYQAAWSELLANQQKCNKALNECIETGKEAIPPVLPTLSSPTKSYWWAWLLTGLAVGFGASWALQ